MVVMGLDPGIARTGYGIVDTTQREMFVSCGCLTTPQGLSTPERLAMLGHDLGQLLRRFRPERAVVETVLFGANAKTAMLTAEARGVLCYTLQIHGVVVHSLTPLQIKSRLTGYGAADKQQMQHVVTHRLKLDSLPQPDDAADALAAALCVADEPLLVLSGKYAI